MGFFDKGNNFDRGKKRTDNRSEGRSEGSGYKKYSDDSPRYSSNKTLTKVSCHACGASCQVPFVPIANKPVYCNDCFRKNDTNPRGEKSTQFRRHSDSDNRSSSPDLSQINAKLDKIIKLLEEG